MKKSKIRLILLIVASVALIVSLTIGGTLAWLTATSKTLTNTFVVGKVEMTLDEKNLTPDTDPDTDDERISTGGNQYKVIPGTKIFKDPTVTIKANSEKCYVYLAVKDGIGALNTSTTEIANFEIASGWTKVTDLDTLLPSGPALPIGVTLYRAVVESSATDSVIPYYVENTDTSVTPNEKYTITFSGEKITKDNIAAVSAAKITFAAFAHQFDNTDEATAINAAVTFFNTLTTW